MVKAGTVVDQPLNISFPIWKKATSSSIGNSLDTDSDRRTKELPREEFYLVRQR